MHRVWDLSMSMEQEGERLSVHQSILAGCVLACDSDQDFNRKLLSHLKFARLCTQPFASDYSKHQ